MKYIAAKIAEEWMFTGESFVLLSPLYIYILSGAIVNEYSVEKSQTGF
jgi:hypothetical protein